MNWAIGAAFVVGTVLVYAGVAKGLGLSGWLDSARRLGVPRVVAIAVPIAELVVGLGVIFGGSQRRGFVTCAVVLLAGFTALLAWNLRFEDRPPCACFGGRSTRPIGGRDVLRNVTLLVLAVVALAS